MVTFIELYEDYLNQRISTQVTKGTLKIYGYTARPFCEWADDNGIKPSTILRKHIRAYIAKLTLSGRAKATVDLHGRNVRAMLRYGHLEGVCPEVNFRGLLPRPPKRKQRVARKEDIDKLLAANSSPRYKAIILLMYESGVRRQETSDLNCGDLDFSLQDVLRILVRSGKGDKDRVTFAGRRTMEALLDYMVTVPHEENDPVFISNRGNRMSVQSIDWLFKTLSKKAGIKITPHAVRRGFAVSHRGMSLWDLKELMGHASIQTTQLYVQLGGDDLLESYRAYDVT